MKKILFLAAMATLSLAANAEEAKKDSVNPNKPVFTTIIENPITSIKNQARSAPAGTTLPSPTSRLRF